MARDPARGRVSAVADGNASAVVCAAASTRGRSTAVPGIDLVAGEAAAKAGVPAEGEVAANR